MVEIVKATIRTDSNSRRIRASGFIPAEIYGGKHPNVSIQLEGEPKANTMLSVVYADSKNKEVTETVIVKSVQRYPVGNKVLHIDLLRVNDDSQVVMPVTVKFVGQDKSKAIKMEGATLGIAVSRVKILTPLKSVPKLIQVDVKDMKIGQTLFATDLTLPEGVSLAEKTVLALCTMNKPRGGVKD